MSGDDDTTTGITSTYVENTLLCLLSLEQLGDHLHIRGEYDLHGQIVLLRSGSPPHTWRILSIMTSNKVPNRITSTYVENTILGNWNFESGGDHLHIRGEYSKQIPL